MTLIRNLAVLLGLAAFAVCEEPGKEEDPMSPAAAAARKDAVIPPIDKEAPAKFETATFALG